MQRVTNCLIIDQDHVLLLKKPRHGWYAMPGGKMEPGESVHESVLREVEEETGLVIAKPQLYSVATMLKESAPSSTKEWMMFTFKTDQFSGEVVEESPEGQLEWIPISKLDQIPTAPSDRLIHQYIINKDQPLYGSFNLDEKDQLISFRLNDH